MNADQEMRTDQQADDKIDFVNARNMEDDQEMFQETVLGNTKSGMDYMALAEAADVEEVGSSVVLSLLVVCELVTCEYYI